MFNRSSLSPSEDSRQASGGRPSYSIIPPGGGYSEMPKPDTRSSGAHGFSGRNPVIANRTPRADSSQSWSLRPTKSPDNSYTYGNLVAVSPSDIPPSRDGSDVFIIVNDLFVFSARPLNGFPAGMISMSDPQRTWAQVALTDVVNVKLYDAFANGDAAYLASMDVEIGFAGKKRTDAPYDQEELGKAVIRNFPNQILAPGQKILMDFKSIPLLLTIRVVQLGRLDEKQLDAATTTVPTARGIFTKQCLVNFFKDARSEMNLMPSVRRPAANAIVQPGFAVESMGIGGLDKEFSTIFRRAFASRIFPPALVAQMGVPHVKGLLLYGPPGTGKTLIARQIGKMLNTRPPKVVNGPEVLNKYVGQSEENIRKLFADAEKEYKEKGEESGLHIIIFDELDAICKQRGSGAGGGTGVGDSVVNQLLSKLDGVDQLNNILLIGMTNRMDLIDEALLRPGRLEVHIEISLPDERGRCQILKIHTQKMSTNQKLGADVDLEVLAAKTKNFSGAEISGLVKAATSYALNRHIKVGTVADVSEDAMNVQVNMDDFMHALEDIQPAFGVSMELLETCIEDGIIRFSPRVDRVLEQGMLHVKASAKDDPSSRSLDAILLHGEHSAGKTALSAKMALDSGFPFVRIITPLDMGGFNEAMKVAHIQKIMLDAHRSSKSIIILDSIEEIIGWSDIGPRFNLMVVEAIRVLLAKQPSKGHHLLIVATTSERTLLERLKLDRRFTDKLHVPLVNQYEELAHVLEESQLFPSQEIERVLSGIREVTQSSQIGVGIKQVLGAVKIANESKDVAEAFIRLLSQHMEESGNFETSDQRPLLVPASDLEP
ncbi:transport between ER and Golgi ATPase protein [Ascosphaera aggregata]|nr:transport between ER and Golgi ATPase protein [Ascosphaera aggregata]